MKEKDFNELKEMLTEIVDECLTEIRKFGYCDVAGMEDDEKQVIAEVYGDTLYETFDGEFIALKEFFDEEDLDELKCYKPKQKEEENGSMSNEQVINENEGLSLMEGCSVNIAKLEKYADKQAYSHSSYFPSSLLKDIDIVECTLDYPLEKPHTFQIELDKFHFGEITSIDVDEILVAIAKEYKKLWGKHKNWFWGHSLNELYFESLTLKGNVIEVGVGS